MRFTGAGGLTSSVTAIALASVSEMSVFVAGSIDNAGSFSRVVSYKGSGDSDDASAVGSYIGLLRFDTTSDLISWRQSNRGGVTIPAYGRSMTMTTRMEIAGANTVFSTRINGGTAGVSSSTTPSALWSTGALAIGSQPLAGSFGDSLTGNIHEVLVISGRVPESLAMQIESYLASRWRVRLARGNPYATRSLTPLPPIGSGVTPTVLTPDATLANTDWSAVGAASLHAALAAGDSDYITASTDGAQALLSFSDPVPALSSLTSATLTFRHRIRPPS